MASSSSYSHSASSTFYHVFLSFRGGDVRKTFVDHLYSALTDRPINVYKDDKALPRGETIGPALFEAIEQSKIAVVVFSKNYADSSWCLDELSHIMRCRDENGLIVMPIFYDVEPSDVRKQKRKFGEAFAKQEANNNANKADSWRKALFDASNISGWEPKHFADGHESELMKEIVDKVWKKMSSSSLEDVDEGLVGMSDRIDELISILKLESSGVRIVGIWGVGGGGKTTLATSVYKKICIKFNGYCIVENVREEFNKGNLEKLQNKILNVFRANMEVPSVTEGKTMIKHMLCHSKVLLVLDDVDDSRQLEALAGSHDWFGSGSRIIITTRDKHLLHQYNVDDVSSVRLLSHKEASYLFKKYAYRVKNDIKDYEILSSRVLYYAHRLPLAVRVTGSFLCDKNNVEWESYLKMLESTPDAEVMDILGISYEGLTNYEKELFLDIACFLRGKSKANAMEILDAFGYYPDIGLKVLEQRALITIVNGCFQMHDLIQEMGHHIIRNEHPNNPEKHSRVWKQEDIRNILSLSLQENDKIEAIYFYGQSHSFEILSKMKKLRWLTVKRADNLNDGLTCYLEGDRLINIVVCCSCMQFLTDKEEDEDEDGDEEDDDERLQFIEDADDEELEFYKDDTEHLKGLDFLSNELQCIIWEDYPANSFPDSSKATKLVVLTLHYTLQKQLWNDIDKHLPRLKVLELFIAKKLLNTPNFNHIPCLETLMLFGCDELTEIHPSLGYHEKLEYICVERCPKIRTFPEIVQMKSLKHLTIFECPEFLEFPVLLNTMPLFFHQLQDGLRELNFIDCQLNDGDIPSDIGQLSNLLTLNLSFNNFSKLPSTILQLTQLKVLDLSGCSNLSKLPSTISELTQLKVFDLSECFDLERFPEFPSSLAVLMANGCFKITSIGDSIKNCKCLCDVQITTYGRILTDFDRLFNYMLQGKDSGNGIWSLQLEGVIEIPNVSPKDNGKGYTLQLPEYWCYYNCGFIMYASLPRSCVFDDVKITMEQVTGDSPGMDYQDDMFPGKSVDDEVTWVGYVPFGSLSHTSWWDVTYTGQISFEIELVHEIKKRWYNSKCRWFGVGLIKKSENGPPELSTSSFKFSSSDDKKYTRRINIIQDSKDALVYAIPSLGWYFQEHGPM
ncbi:disease resistance protein RPV1-like [Rutidosis leptorrhynchoides]|uniref:disease resistance protein RPV1-like n=1 Tax=Rutidosis leptorrhynchoides TaxID=125765 RepID=UPI003A9932C5